MKKKIIISKVVENCKVDAYIIEYNKKTTLTIDLNRFPKQAVIIGKKCGDIFRMEGIDLTYRIDLIYNEEEIISEELPKTEKAPDITLIKNIIEVAKPKLVVDKSMAKNIFINKGYKISDNYTFATKNKTSNIYWANPKFSMLKQDWYLILNDNINDTMYLLIVPGNSIPEYKLKPKSNNPDKIDMKIYYNDSTFTDMLSKYSFKKYFVDYIEY